MADKRIRLISLDIETSGLNPAKHVPLSIGAVDIASGRDYFVGLEWDELTVTPTAMRINRIDITRSDRDVGDGIYGYGSGSRTPEGPFSSSRPGRTLPAAKAIEEFALWLQEIWRGDEEEIRALGKNPASFDLPMLRPTWERLQSDSVLSVTFGGRFPFSYRCVDLNSVFVAIAAVKGGDANAVKDVITELAWDDLRKEAPQLPIHGEEMLPGRDKHYAMFGTWNALSEATGGNPEHNALGDAWWNAYAWQRCVQMLREEL